MTVVKRITDLVKEQDIAVQTLAHYPELNNSIKMEVGIEDCLHIEFEYNKSKYALLSLLSAHVTICHEYRNTRRTSSLSTVMQLK